MSLVVILGMHRSGTSCLTHMLHRAGLYLGDDVMAEEKSDNLGGHWEANEAMTINELALMLSGGTWNRVPSEIIGNETINARMAAFVAQLATRSLAGWKDPRTTLTFPLWKPHLADYRLVVCLRHPLAVARSLSARQHGTIDEGVALWMAYQRRLLEYLPTEPRVEWFDFDAPRTALLQQVVALCQMLGLEVGDQVLATFNEQLRHQSFVEGALPADAQQMYDRLRRLAWDNMRSHGVLLGGDEVCEERDPIGALRSQLEDLLTARRGENLVLQEIDARLRAIERAAGQPVEATIVQKIEQLEARLEEQASTIERLRAALRPGSKRDAAPHF